MENNKFNEKDSLELITRMIQNTQNKLTKNEGRTFLIWGYLTVFITLAVWSSVTYTGNYYWNFLWLAIPIVGWSLTLIYEKKDRTQKGTKSYLETIINYIWLVLTVLTFTFTISSSLNSFSHILFITLQLIGAGVVLTGLIIKFKPSIYSGITVLILSLSTLFIENNNYTFLIFVLSFISMMIIPGHILNYKWRRQKNMTQC